MRLNQNLKTCGECAFRSQDGTHCGLTNTPINPKEDFCSKLETSPKTCDICGQFIVGPGIIDAETTPPHYICYNCLKSIKTCARCKNNTRCEFEENPSSTPKVIQQHIQQGPMVAITNVKNPQRIKETCEKLCGCFDSTVGCLRQYGTCANVNFHY